MTDTSSDLPDWVSEINEIALGWFQAARIPPTQIFTQRPPSTGAAIAVTPGAATFAVSPGVLLVGALAIVAVLWIWKS